MKRGFTLLEAMLAMGMIVVGLVALVSLAWVSVVSARSANEQFVAAGIAQEGIEAVRSLRDTNWLAFDADSSTEWTAGLMNAGQVDYTAVLTADTDTTQGQWLLDFTPNAFGDTCTEISGEDFDCTAMWLDTATNRYTQRTDSDFDVAQHATTPYRRLIALYPICRDPEDDTDEAIVNTATDTCASLGSQYEQVGLNVIVTVQWQGRGTNPEYVLEERMYDWKY